MRRVDRISGESQVSGSFWSREPNDLLDELRCDSTGLTSTEASRRLSVFGPNRIGADRHASTTTLLIRQFGNPIVLLLIAATLLSLFLGDEVNAAIVLVIVLASAGMGFVQERSAVNAAWVPAPNWPRSPSTPSAPFSRRFKSMPMSVVMASRPKSASTTSCPVMSSCSGRETSCPQTASC